MNINYREDRSNNNRRLVTSNSTSGVKKKNAFAANLADQHRDMHASDGKINMPMDPYSFGNTGQAYAHKGSLQIDSALSA